MRDCRDINELHPVLKDLALKLVERCRQEGINIKIGETYRSVERQEYLYAQGRTRAGNIVTYARGTSMSSYHQWRLAFDVFQNIRGDEYNLTVLKKVGKIGKELGLEWGGDWTSFRDYPHFQYTFGLSISDLRNGKKPPNITSIHSDTNKPQTIANGDKNYIKAVETIAKKNIINSKDYWINATSLNVEYVKGLIIKCASYLEGKTVKTYEEAVAVCVKRKIIGDTTLWKSPEKLRDVHVRSFIIKISVK